MIFKLQYPRGCKNVIAFNVLDHSVQITGSGRMQHVTVPVARDRYREFLSAGYKPVAA